MAKKAHKFRQIMIDQGTKAAQYMKRSPIQKQLTLLNYTAQDMAARVRRLADLKGQVDEAKSHVADAEALLEAEAAQFGSYWSSYCNHVRGFTSDQAVRDGHQVKSPGSIKGPRFRRTGADGAPSKGKAGKGKKTTPPAPGSEGGAPSDPGGAGNG